MKLAYLLGQYPAANHAFMLSEITRLRQLRFEIVTASIAAPDRPASELTAGERAAAETTFYVKRAGVFGALQAHSLAFLRAPVRYAKAFLYALSLGDWQPRKTLSSFFYLTEAALVGEWMRRERVTHLHTHYSSTVGLLTSRLFPVTFSVTFHGPDEFKDPKGFRLREKVEASRFVCAISEYAREELKKWSREGDWGKIETAPLGVNTSAFEARPFRAAPSPFRLVCAARLAPVKGQRHAIAAIDRLAREGRDIALHLAGAGPDRAALEAEAKARGLERHIVFEGLLNRDRLIGLYRDSDAMLLASFDEGVPVALMEAMAMEIPCVATAVAGVPELIDDGKNGLLCPPGDERALAAAIARLMDDDEFRRSLGRAARRKTLEKYDLERN